MRKNHESRRPSKCVLWYLLVPLGLAMTGCGGRDVAGPVPAAKLSTDKVSYERKPSPGLQRLDAGELVVTEKLKPAVLVLPPAMDKNTEIIAKGTLRWPKAAGKVTLLRLEFYEPRQFAEVTLNEGLAFVKEKDGLYEFETDRMKTPIEFVGKCKVRLWAYATPLDHDPSSGVAPTQSSVVVGQTEMEIR